MKYLHAVSLLVVKGNIVKGDDPIWAHKRPEEFKVTLYPVVGVVAVNEKKIKSLSAKMSRHCLNSDRVVGVCLKTDDPLRCLAQFTVRRSAEPWIVDIDRDDRRRIVSD